MLPTAILISGRGSNMASLLRAAADPAYPAKIVAVLSNRPDAPGLAVAREAGVEAVAMINPERQRERPSERPSVLMKSQAQRFMSFLLGPGVTALSDSFSKFSCDGPDHSRGAGLREAAGNQGTVCHVPRVQCGTACRTPRPMLAVSG